MEHGARHFEAGDLLYRPLRAHCSMKVRSVMLNRLQRSAVLYAEGQETRFWSAMLDRTWWSAMLNTEAGDLLDHPFGALCSTKFDRSAMLYCHTAERLALR